MSWQRRHHVNIRIRSRPFLREDLSEMGARQRIDLSTGILIAPKRIPLGMDALDR